MINLLVRCSIAIIFMKIVFINGVQFENCTIHCGSNINISYPFRLKDQPHYCGNNSFELSCENNQTILYNNYGRYFVKDINYYSGYMLLLADGFNKNNVCSIPRTPNLIDPYYSSTYSVTTLFYLACSNKTEFTNYVDMSYCLNGSSSPNPYFYATIDQFYASTFPKHCFLRSRIRALPDLSKGNLSIHGIHDALEEGIYFQWDYPDHFHKSKWTEKVQQAFQDFWIGFLDFWTYFPWIVIYYRSQIFEGVAGRSFVIIVLLAPIFIRKFMRRHLSMDEGIEEFLSTYESSMPIRYSFSDLKKITGGFKEKLGQGGYGSVYKGKLRSGKIVAIKLLNELKGDGQDFINEVATIGRIHHVNIVRLVGFCVERSRKALIYDFMSNGSLDKFIFSQGKTLDLLSWEDIFKIAVGVAQGIDYLHYGCDMQILHFDIKPHNILLDENLTPKVSDFGLAKLYPMGNNTIPLTAARGTLGYIAPELFYKNIGSISRKADVYSFGMVLIEMVGKRRNFDIPGDSSSHMFFSSWIYDHIDRGEQLEILEEATEAEKNLAMKLVIVALWCLQLKPTDRPIMNNVLKMLEGDITLLELPPKPSLYPQGLSNMVQEDNIGPVHISSQNVLDSITIEAR